MKTAKYECLECGSVTMEVVETMGKSCFCIRCRNFTPHKRKRGTTIETTHKIKLSNSTFTLDTMATENDMRDACPLFFKNKPRNGKETYTVYKGCLIVRQTVHFSSGTSRRTIAYMFGYFGNKKRSDSKKRQKYTLSCIKPKGGECVGIDGARILIDRILKEGSFIYE